MYRGAGRTDKTREVGDCHLSLVILDFMRRQTGPGHGHYLSRIPSRLYLHSGGPALRQGFDMTSFLSFLAIVLTRPSDAQLSNRREDKTNHVCSTRRSRNMLICFEVISPYRGPRSSTGKSAKSSLLPVANEDVMPPDH
ncbi:hypothetical protein FJTKL_13162 [Diaporthe vaccinii]|uniref:Uncharacterized protein n=1 Tax=Diaporthe vaccinii TaxID=105482 RepID=A0ABR4EBH8_9PEZI